MRNGPHLARDARDLGDAYAVAAQAWCDQVPGRSGAVRFVARRFRHITLSWVDVPAAVVTVEQVDRLRAGLADALAETPPFRLTIGPAVVNRVAIELYLRPSPALTELHARVADVYRDVFPRHEPAPAGKRFRAHTAIAYCSTDVDDEGLAGALLRASGPVAGYLGPVATTVDHVLLAPTDAWSTHGMWWDEDHEHVIPFGGDHRGGTLPPVTRVADTTDRA